MDSASDSDHYISLSKSTLHLLETEKQSFAAIDPSVLGAPVSPFGDSDDLAINTRKNELHRQRGRKLDSLKKSLPDDGYFNLPALPNAWQSHPVITSRITESDVKKSAA